uniref:K+ potassium transporter integral membrane domain-containing protein n=1 Tax=Lactuca sativa TaxID=4236 RepID=A0A9R1V3A0_LACSA|nr:hypothetical protein LSAT_V11C700353160 [Lactuca sativa]
MGQIYIPVMNWFLLAAVLLLVTFIASTDEIRTAYGRSDDDDHHLSNPCYASHMADQHHSGDVLCCHFPWLGVHILVICFMGHQRW